MQIPGIDASDPAFSAQNPFPTQELDKDAGRDTHRLQQLGMRVARLISPIL